MLKKFIACQNQKERFCFFDATRVSDWTEEEIDAVAQIAGVSFEEGMDLAAKYMKLCNELRTKATRIA